MANRNSESRFAQVPRANIPRAKFKRDFGNLTTINEGDLVPIYCDEVLPGDTISIKQTSLIRMATPIYPVMDNAYCDVYYFYVPSRLLWEHWENLMGQNDDSYWAQRTEYTTPTIKAPTGGWNVGTIADYFGIPTGVEGIEVNALPFRAYTKIWNEWFRDENLQQPQVEVTGDAQTSGNNTATGPTSSNGGGPLLKVAKYHDYFTSCLPEPQKGDAAGIPITLPDSFPVTTEPLGTSWAGKVPSTPLAWFIADGSGDAFTAGSGSYNAAFVNIGKDTSNATERQYTYGVNWSTQTSSNTSSAKGIAPANLYAELPIGTTEIGISINELRTAIALQHILEADARGGTRYTEILSHEYGVTSPDSRLQRSEYIGGSRFRININQVVQNSATDATSPQGNVAAYSLTTDSEKMVTYSAVEFGYIIGLAAIRVNHSYQQGLSRMWTRSDRWSYYNPLFANLSEMPVYNKEIYAQGTEEDDEVFGYQEAWADLRYRTNMITGEMRSQYDQSLDAWHYADYYEELPKLSSSWIVEGKENVDRTIAVQSEISHQFICDLWFDQTWTRPLPIYSVPGINTI